MLMIRPPLPLAIISFPAAWDMRKVPFTLTSITRSNLSRGISSGGAPQVAPLLLMTMSTPPKFSLAAATTRTTSSGRVTSQGRARASPPFCSIDSFTSRQASTLREQITTRAPASAKASAMCLPRPRPPPVTMAVFPSRRNRSSALNNCSSSPSRGLSPLFFQIIDDSQGGNEEVHFQLPVHGVIFRNLPFPQVFPHLFHQALLDLGRASAFGKYRLPGPDKPVQPPEHFLIDGLWLLFHAEVAEEDAFRFHLPEPLDRAAHGLRIKLVGRRDGQMENKTAILQLVVADARRVAGEQASACRIVDAEMVRRMARRIQESEGTLRSDLQRIPIALHDQPVFRDGHHRIKQRVKLVLVDGPRPRDEPRRIRQMAGSPGMNHRLGPGTALEQKPRTSGMIQMDMGDDHIPDIGGIQAQFHQSLQNARNGRTRTGIHQRQRLLAEDVRPRPSRNP